MRTTFLVPAWIAVSVLVSPAEEAPVRMSHQGRLLNSGDGSPVSSNVTVVVSLYTNAVAGDALYAESIGTVPVNNGLFAFEFGTPALSGVIRGNDELWLGLQINGEPLAPRHRLLPTAYAVRSRVTDEVGTNTLFPAGVIPGTALVDGSVPVAKLDPAIQDVFTNLQIAAGFATNVVAKSGDVMTGPLGLPAGGLSVGATQLVVTSAGRVGIGTANPATALSVNGTVKAREVVVSLDGWADDVFAPGYRLAPLEDVAAHVREHGHLPGVPAERTVMENGVAVGEMQKVLLRKVEELTLYVIELRRENEALKSQIKSLGVP